MENAVDALKIAFAVMVLVIALSVSINSFNGVKAAADSILYMKDETNYQEYQGVVGKASENRIVGMETVIPMLYRYYKENYTIVFKEGKYDYSNGTFENLKYKNVYKTASNDELWNDSYKTKMNDKYGTISDYKNIFSFDLDEEILRNEPWTASIEKTKSNLDAFLNGATFTNPSNDQPFKDYANDSFLGKGGFIEKYKDKKFVETIEEYEYYEDKEEVPMIEYVQPKKKIKRIITFTLIMN